MILLAIELKNHRYCMWHNAVSHNSYDCRVFYKEIQWVIEVGRIKFDASEKSMKIDGHPFPANMVDAKDQDAKTGPKMLTSERA